MQRAVSVGSFNWVHHHGSHHSLHSRTRSRHRLHGDQSHEALLTVGYVSRNRSLSRCTHKSSVVSSVGYHDVDEAKSLSSETTPAVGDDNDEIEQEPETFKRRFYILFLFSIVAFMQYCCWNTFGPISTTCMTAFDWTEGQIAFLASLDPFTYLVTMLVFSWAMDVKGLRISMLISAGFMALGTGLRCVTADKEYTMWTMAAGQFFNGLAGPVTQAAPPLLSTNWFPSNERTTATAVASLCGSFGIALSFIIGPTMVKDIDVGAYRFIDPYNNFTSAFRAENKSLNDPEYLSATVLSDAKFYWPFNIRNKNFKYTLKDWKQRKRASVTGKIETINTFSHGGVLIRGQRSTINFGELEGTCLSNLNKCPDGFSLSLWINLANIKQERFIVGTKSSKDTSTGFFINAIKTNNTTSLHIQVRTMRVQHIAEIDVKEHTWNQLTFTWNATKGLDVYLNASHVASPLSTGLKSSTGSVDDFKSLDKDESSNNLVMGGFAVTENEESLVGVDELAIWSRRVDVNLIRMIYSRMLFGSTKGEEMEAEKVLEDVIDSRRDDVMKLLYIEFSINAVLFILVLVYFPDKPPIPPSLSAFQKREDFFIGAKQLLRNRNFWTLALIYGLTTGVYSGWGAVLNVNLSSFGVTQKEAGWLGFYAVLAGIGAGMLLARCADVISGRMKILLLVLFVGSTASFLWFCLLCLRIIHYDRDSLCKSAIIGGFCVSGTIPLFYELTIEQTYPIAEGTTSGLLTLINNIVTVLFLIVLLIPGIGTTWMNWTLFAACAACLPVLIFLKENYNRLNVDLDENLNEVDNTAVDSRVTELEQEQIELKPSSNGTLKTLPKVIQKYIRNPREIGTSLWSLASGDRKKIPNTKNVSTNPFVVESFTDNNDISHNLKLQHTPRRLRAMEEKWSGGSSPRLDSKILRHTPTRL